MVQHSCMCACKCTCCCHCCRHGGCCVCRHTTKYEGEGDENTEVEKEINDGEKDLSKSLKGLRRGAGIGTRSWRHMSRCEPSQRWQHPSPTHSTPAQCIEKSAHSLPLHVAYTAQTARCNTLTHVLHLLLFTYCLSHSNTLQNKRLLRMYANLHCQGFSA